MKLLNVLCSLAGVALLTGCTTLESISSGHVGCTPDKIQISNHTSNNWDADSWVATCNGKRFVCHSQNQGSSSCTPEQ